MLDRKLFYTAEPNEIRVTKEEFDKFLDNYPRNLDSHVMQTCDPPLVTFNDFELANRWPYSIVARTWIYGSVPGSRYYEPEENRSYYIVSNYTELFNSKTGFEA